MKIRNRYIVRYKFCFLLALALLATPCDAQTIEEVVELPVTVSDMYGKSVAQNIKVTVFRDDKRARSPFLVLNHGRPANTSDFVKMGRQKFSDNAKYFVS